MAEMFPGRYPAGDYQEQKTPETEGGVASGRMGNLALEASGVASPKSDKSTTAEIAARDSSDYPKEKLSPADELRARLAGFQAGTNKAAPEAAPKAASSGYREKARADLLAVLRGGNKKSADTDTQSPENKAAATNESTDDRSESNTQGDEQQPEMNSERLRELIDNCLQAAQSAREGLNRAMQSIDMAGNVSSGGFRAGLAFANGNLNQVGNAAQVLEGATSQKEIALLGNSVNEVQLRIRSLDADVRSGVNVDRGYLSRLLERVDEMVRFVAELRDRQDQDRREQAKEGNDSSLD